MGMAATSGAAQAGRSCKSFRTRTLEGEKNPMQFCSQCGSPVTLSVPEGDNRERHVCTDCGVIHYQNPRMVVGSVPEWEGQVLLCRRAIEPRRGFWTLPAGFLELGESAEAGAMRETLEEAGARVELVAPFTLFSVPHVNQVHIYYRARLSAPEYLAGEESLEVALHREAEVPWEQLAFTTVRETLRHWFADRAAGRWGVHHGTVHRDPNRSSARGMV